MAKVNWEKFCALQHIEYLKTAASFARGYINIHCPFCGDTDQSYHLGLHKSGRWTCYRDPVSHKGSDPHRIIMRLIGCNYEQANSYVLDDVVELSDFDEAASEFMLDNNELKQQDQLEFPTEFRPLTSPRGRAKMYWNYLITKRGFRSSDTPKLTRRYDLHYCDKGMWRGRIIIPIQINEKLLSWTGRTVYDTEELRYRSLSHKKDAEPRGLVNVRDLLFNYDNAIKEHHHVCVIVEGPLDVIKVDYYGHRYGICAVGTFGTGIREAQLDMLYSIREKCDILVVCGDQNAEVNVMNLLSAAYDIDVQNLPLPDNVKDPAELTKHEIINLFSKL